MPWPWKGTIACAASPSNTVRSSRCQRVRCRVPSMPTGLRDQSSSKSGISASASPNSRLEQRPRGAGVGQGVEARRAVQRQEQRDREGVLGVRQRDAHVAAARPDVQRVAARAGSRHRRPAESPVPCSRGRAARSARPARSAPASAWRTAEPAPSAPTSDSKSQRFAAAVAVVDAAAGGAGRSPRRCMRCIEVQARAGRFGGVEQADVEAAAVHRPDHLAVVAAVAL